MNGWLEEDDDMNENVNDKDIEDEDVEIEGDDEAELIFPYEVEGDQTPPPPAESSDSEPPIAEPPNADVIEFHVVIGASHTRARLIEAEVGTNRTETALLDSKIKIGEKERKILDYDLGNVEKTLSNVVERLKILESGENATLKKKLEEYGRCRAVFQAAIDEEDDGRSEVEVKEVRQGGWDLLSHGVHLT
ncbi:hypothetical protein Tco_0874502 [Tanacetum coccineum]|uniref:BAG domain-containing protein n=1 Tax=Tanacetum coccineum TaxID=301880 RepID=A0ABQ5BPW8_9ASTR